MFTILNIYWKYTARAKFDTEEKTCIGHYDFSLHECMYMFLSRSLGGKEDKFLSVQTNKFLLNMYELL